MTGGRKRDHFFILAPVVVSWLFRSCSGHYFLIHHWGFARSLACYFWGSLSCMQSWRWIKGTRGCPSTLLGMRVRSVGRGRDDQCWYARFFELHNQSSRARGKSRDGNKSKSCAFLVIAIIVCDMNSKKCSGELSACPIEGKREAKRKKRK